MRVSPRPVARRPPAGARPSAAGRSIARAASAGRGTRAGAAPVPDVDVVEVRDDGIRLGQFVKLAGLADDLGTGGEVKLLISAGEVRVNGEVDVRRGRQLQRGDVVTVRGRSARVG